MTEERKSFQCDFICVHEDIVRRVMASLPDEATLVDLGELFKLFADATRVKILYCLLAHEMCVCDIATLLKMTQSAISHQLSVLRRGKLVAPRREGKTVFYALADDHVRTILSQGIEHVTE
ncbi:MAG: helix-turn-helix transcriptional regulator [Clostridiales bacterium]|nr:helix-turn-helix transcriptional regulator [Clostridiales bacterium]